MRLFDRQLHARDDLVIRTRANPAHKLTIETELVFNEPHSQEAGQEREARAFANTKLKNSNARVGLEVMVLLEHALLGCFGVPHPNHQKLLCREMGDREIHDPVEDLVRMPHPAVIVDPDRASRRSTSSMISRCWRSIVGSPVSIESSQFADMSASRVCVLRPVRSTRTNTVPSLIARRQ